MTIKNQNKISSKNMDESIYGLCDYCGCKLEPIWFIENEFNNFHHETGRTRLSVDYLLCPTCGKKYACDDSFDGNWR